MKSSLGDKQRLLHILEAIEEIENCVSGVNLDTFLQSSMMRFASVKQIEIIGEAANNISEEVKNKFTEIQWRQITDLRHVLDHDYFGVDSKLIWQIIADDIPDLKIKINEVLLSTSE
jgi:uncharacterized protein with HEPN domain